MRYGTVVLAVAWFGASQCGSRPTDGEPPPSTAQEPTTVEFQEVTTQVASGLTARHRMVIREPSDWAELWREAMADRTPAPDVPAVDFDRFVIIVASMGARPTGGYSIAIDRVAREGDRLIVSVLEVEPGPGCATTQAFTSPWTAVRIPATDGPLSFVERNETAQCRRL